MIRRNFLHHGFFGASALPLLGQSLLGQEESDVLIKSSSLRVLVPTTVFDRETRDYIANLKPEDFRILDNGIEQERIEEDLTVLPISLVLVVQKSFDMEPFFPEIKRMASTIETQILGEDGEVAVIGFDNRVRVLTEFTSEAENLRTALQRLTPGSEWANQIDAMNTAIRMLKRRAGNRKRVIVLISEEKDRGSEGRARDTLRDLEFSSIIVYGFNVSQLVRTILKKPGYPRPNPVPVQSRGFPGGPSVDPVTAQTMYGYGSMGNVAPLIKNIMEGVKDVFISSETELWTKYTGGRNYNFKGLKELERAFLRLRDDLQSQYLLSYSPSQKVREIGGYHTIQVIVKGSRNWEVRTRPGYWAAAKFN
jgi:VWFA-related protein